MYAVLIILGVLILFSVMPFKVQIKYLLYKETNRFTVKIGILHPAVTMVDSARAKKTRASKSGGGKSEKTKMNFEFLINAFREVAQLFDYFKKKLKITTLRLHFHIGLSDAAATGIVTGSAWGALYDAAALLDYHFRLYDKNIHVAPDFTREIFETDIEVVLSIKVFYLFVFAYRTYKSIKKLDIFNAERNDT